MKRIWLMILVLCLMMMPASGLGEAQLAENRGESIPLDEEPAADEISPDDVPEEEELALIECDARGRSVQQVAMALHVSYETVKRRRRSALLKISRT